MPITVPSPHNGRPVKVRDQDVGRAVRDEDGRIFYVLPSRDGEGHYGALTRSGDPKQEKRAAELVQTPPRPQPESAAPAAPHDATGTPRRSPRAVLAMAGVLILAALVYLLVWGPGRDWLVRPQQSGEPLEKVVPESPGANQTPLPPREGLGEGLAVRTSLTFRFDHSRRNRPPTRAVRGAARIAARG